MAVDPDTKALRELLAKAPTAGIAGLALWAEALALLDRIDALEAEVARLLALGDALAARLRMFRVGATWITSDADAIAAWEAGR